MWILISNPQCCQAVLGPPASCSVLQRLLEGGILHQEYQDLTPDLDLLDLYLLLQSVKNQKG